MKTHRASLFALGGFLFLAGSAAAADYRIELSQTIHEIRPGLSTSVWSYGGTVPGTPIVVNVGEREIWKDTVPVAYREYVDVEFVMAYPGDWMLHCRIIDHEDGGMMTMVRAR